MSSCPLMGDFFPFFFYAAAFVQTFNMYTGMPMWKTPVNVMMHNRKIVQKEIWNSFHLSEISKYLKSEIPDVPRRTRFSAKANKWPLLVIAIGRFPVQEEPREASLCGLWNTWGSTVTASPLYRIGGRFCERPELSLCVKCLSVKSMNIEKTPCIFFRYCSWCCT